MSDVRRTLRPFLVKEWPALSAAAASTIVLTIADLAAPWPLKLIIDQVVAGRTDAFTLGPDEVRLLAVVAAIVVGIAIVEGVARYLSDLLLKSAGERISHELRVSVYDHLQRLSLGFHQRRQKGDLVTRVTGDANSVGDLFSHSLGEVVQAGLLLTGMIAVTLYLDPLLALVSLSTAPLLALVSVIYRRRLRATARRQRAQEGAIASLANEALSAMPVVKAYGSEIYEGARVKEKSATRMTLGIELSRMQARFDGLLGVLNAIGIALVLVVGAFRVSTGAISAGDLVIFATYARKVSSPLRSLAREWGKIARSMARAERIAEILAADDVLVERPGAHRSGRARGEVELAGVSFAYSTDRPAVHDVSLSIPAGARVAVIGPSGAGKSTIGALVARFYDPDSGAVRLDGRDARDCAVDWYRGQVGVLLQDTMLFTGTVADNIAYGSGASRDQVIAAARAADAHEFVSALADGYDTPLGPQGVGLSGGQRQRIGIARTLLRNPPVLVLDEPTTGLDTESEERVVRGLEALMAGRTTILVTHSLALAARADQVLVVDGGRIVAAGPPAEVLSAEETIERLAGEQESARRGDVSPPPPDAELPALVRLLDADAMRPVLERSLPDGARVERVRVARIRYKPGDRVIVHYTARVDGERADAVAAATASADLAARARSESYARVARAVAGRVPAREPVAYDGDLDALLSWLPFDVSLIALTTPPAELRARLRAAGVDVGDGEAEPALIGYKPRARAVLRLGRHVLKAYGKERAYERARAGLEAAAASGLPTPRFAAAIPDLRLTVQDAVAGAAPTDAVAAAGRAGELARALRESPFGGVPAMPAEDQLDMAMRRAAVVAAVAPAARGRLEALLARLAATIPAGLELAPAHGDFHLDQLLRTEDGVLLLDFDDICAAPAALDIASYAADVVRGRDGDLDALDGVLAPLLEGYGERPEALDWYLATAIVGCAPRPFHRLLPGWSERVEAMIETADAVSRAAVAR